VYHQEAVKQYAAEFGIYLLSIRPGLINERQPLDRFLFGAMKARSLRGYGTHDTALESTNKQIAAPSLIRGWKAVNALVLNDTWAQFEELEEDQQ
jgi:hypothetical protein